MFCVGRRGGGWWKRGVGFKVRKISEGKLAWAPSLVEHKAEREQSRLKRRGFNPFDKTRSHFLQSAAARRRCEAPDTDINIRRLRRRAAAFKSSHRSI